MHFVEQSSLRRSYMHWRLESALYLHFKFLLIRAMTKKFIVAESVAFLKTILSCEIVFFVRELYSKAYDSKRTHDYSFNFVH